MKTMYSKKKQAFLTVEFLNKYIRLYTKDSSKLTYETNS